LAELPFVEITFPPWRGVISNQGKFRHDTLSCNMKTINVD